MERSAIIAATHKWMAPGLRYAAKGRRAFSDRDEDSITMAVEAARDNLSNRRSGDMTRLVLAFRTMLFADMLNARNLGGAPSPGVAAILILGLHG